MVLFDNVTVGQRVEVLRAGCIYPGTVKFKGFLNGVPGEWVGVELDHKDGKHDGMIGGRRYFQCMPGHGIFTTASKIRFMQTKRGLYNNYVTKNPSYVEETLFSKAHQEVLSPRESRISKSYREMVDEYPYADVYERPYFPLRHSVGNTIPAATMLSTKRQLQYEKCYGYNTYPYHVEYDVQPEEFISSPAIPKTHMPHMAQKRQMHLGWDRDRYIRDRTVNTAREAMIYRTWNQL